MLQPRDISQCLYGLCRSLDKVLNVCDRQYQPSYSRNDTSKNRQAADHLTAALGHTGVESCIVNGCSKGLNVCNVVFVSELC